MENIIASYYRDYVGSSEGFEIFHNQVLNMPRDAFEGAGLSKLQTLAYYLLSIKNFVSPNGNNYKEILNLIASNLDSLPENSLRDQDLEQRYFHFIDIDEHYDDEGRMFRHLMGLCAFFGMIKSLSKTKKIILFDRCEDFISLNADNVQDFANNLSLNINIKDNDFIKHLEGLPDIRPDADYRPTLGILKYMEAIERPVTTFELSVLLGRVDNLQKEYLIIQRALDIGRQFSSIERNAQQQEFFRAMGWVDSQGNLFVYKSSQQPWFKFRTYLLLLIDFNLIIHNKVTNSFLLTDSAKALLGDLPANVLDLNRVINKLNLDSGTMSDMTMKDILIKTNLDTLTALVAQRDFVEQVNKYSLNNPIIRNNKRARNQFIAELAKIRENYQCQAGSVTFEGQNGRRYVEAHHIIEFSKGGPDVLENLLAIGPTPHTQLHRGSDRAIRDMYINLMNRGAINYGLFETMADKYHCLTRENVDFLVSKGLISSDQQRELLSKIQA